MECKQALTLLSAHIDQELGMNDSIELDAHLLTCACCREQHTRLMALRTVVKTQTTYFSAPTHLESQLKRHITSSVEKKASRTIWWLNNVWNRQNLSTVLISLVAISWSLTLYLIQPSASERLADEVIASHVRSLMLNHIADVDSSDQHTVKPWFNGKLDFSPTVSDLSADGFSLIGGRLDYLDHRPVAALVYRHRQHLINLYVWPVTNQQQVSEQTQSQRGYHLVHWGEVGMTYWAVSDLDSRELLGMVDKLREHQKTK